MPKTLRQGGGGSIISCRRLCAFCTNGFNTAAPKWSDFLFWNQTFWGKKIQNWSDVRCIFRCIALNWYFSREWNDKGIVLRYLKTLDFQNCQFLSHKGWPYIKMGKNFASSLMALSEPVWVQHMAYGDDRSWKLEIQGRPRPRWQLCFHLLSKGV